MPNRNRDLIALREVIESERFRKSPSLLTIALGIDVQGETASITLAENQLRETRKPLSRVGIRIGARTRDVRLIANTMSGFAVDLSDLRKP